MSGVQGQPVPAKTSFVQRRIDLVFDLHKDHNPQKSRPNDGMSLTIGGLRTSADIHVSGDQTTASCDLRVHGLTFSQANDLSTLGKVFSEITKDFVSVYAGDAGSGLALAFKGNIHQATVNYENAPDVGLTIQARAGYSDAVTPVPARSYNGGTDVAVIMAGLAVDKNYKFENNGVSVMLDSPYLPGTWDAQRKSAAKAANINAEVIGDLLTIWPIGGSRQGTPIEVSPATGLVGYPTYNSVGIGLQTLYNPNIARGKRLLVKSSLAPACGEWIVRTIAHNLEAETYGGAWFSNIVATRKE